MEPIREYIIKELGSRYWQKGDAYISQLPIVSKEISRTPHCPRMIPIIMPDWIMDIAVEGMLLVPEWAITPGIPLQDQWPKIDWLAVSFWYLNAIPEQEFENRSGPIHSYSFKLKGWDPRIWEHAWVNRIALFLRRWASLHFNIQENEVFSILPPYKIHVTHDVDAIDKTIAIRFKQSIFNITNALKLLLNLNFSGSFSRVSRALRFVFSNEKYWFFNYILQQEEKYQMKSLFNFYSGELGKNRTWKEALFDPGYEINDQEIMSIMTKIVSSGHNLGLHQSFNAWNNKDKMQVQKKRLEEVAQTDIVTCRQHWLRFSWKDTWKIQQELGFEKDMTLAFNDRAGFRNSSALAFRPWNINSNRKLNLIAIPTVFMDSHFYDYQILPNQTIKQNLNRWISEIKCTHGEAAIIWHQQVMGKDYGWADGFEYLLSIL